jgi:HAD superfamily hydrolase (TIGR01484 family)
MFSMKQIQDIPSEICKNLRGIFCDLDDTLTNAGKLFDVSYSALWQAYRAGMRIVVITGRPAGWVDHIARMWPVNAVVGENGAFYFWMEEGKMHRYFVQDAAKRKEGRERLARLAEKILKEMPQAAIAADQGYRESDLAIDHCEDIPPLGAQGIEKIVRMFKEEGAQVKISSIHVNGWFGSFDKLTTCRNLLENHWHEKSAETLASYLYCGDSPNDEPMFAAFPHSVGVANIAQWLSYMKSHPAYKTSLPGGEGFAELINCILQKRNG